MIRTDRLKDFGNDSAPSLDGAFFRAHLDGMLAGTIESAHPSDEHLRTVMRISSHSLTAFLLFSAVLAAYAVMAFIYPVGYIWATYEDLYGEWAQTYFFAIALLFSVALAISRQRQRLFFTFLAMACFYVVMEEISWGQRILGFETPELLKHHNIQKEANIHNLFTGPIDTWTKRALEYLMAVGFLVYGVLYPLLIRAWARLRNLEMRWLPAPPFYLWPFFAAAAFLELGYLNFNEAEIAEILVGAVLAMLCGHYWLLNRDSLDEHNCTGWPSHTSSRLAALFLVLFGASGTLAFATTDMLQRDPAIKADTDSRLLNGYEKFASRYAGYERWHEAADLYLKVHEAEPSRTSIMRRLADVYRNLGNIAGFNRYNQMSLDTLLAKQASNPGKVSTNLALGRTYRQRGVSAKAIEHLRRAHALAMQRYMQSPENANNAYWLANTYKELGDLRSAARYYQEAFEAEPDRTKYRKAYYAMKDYVADGRAEEADND